MTFQMTFAITTPALIVGAFADRMKFSALVLFMTLWLLIVYSPLAHWGGGGGFPAGGGGAGRPGGMPTAAPQIATATAALAWMFAEWVVHKKPSVLGIISGAVAGLVAITPAAGFVGPMGAFWIGIAARPVCFFVFSTV